MGSISDLTATEDQTFEVSFTANDEDGPLECTSEYLSYSSQTISKVGANNAVTWSGDWPNCMGTVTPLPDAFGVAELKFNVTDKEFTAERSFKVSITNVNDPPTGSVKCNNSTSNVYLVGKESANWTLNCNNALDPDPETLTYQLVKQNEKDISGITCTDPINGSNGSFSGQFAASPKYGTCIYKVKACDASEQCTPLSSFEVQITSYQQTISTVDTPSLNASCVASSSASFTFSDNISSINYTAKTGINSDAGVTNSTSASPVNFSYNVPNFLISRTQIQENTNLTAEFRVTSATFKNSVSGGSNVTQLLKSSSFTIRRELESITPRWPTSYSIEEVNLDGFQPSFNSTSSVCRHCSGSLISLSAGSTHTCVTENSTLKCMGDNSDSKLGTGTTTSFSYPRTATQGSFTVTQVSAGSNFTCTLGHNSTTPEIRCAGSNNSGQLGLTSAYSKFDSSVNRVIPPTNHTPIAVSAAKFGEFACGIFNDSSGSDGKVYCWGKNEKGQLGNNSNTTPSAGTLVGIAGSQGNSDFIALSAGARHACGVRKETSTTSKVYCWGDGVSGQLGNNGSSSSTPVSVQGSIDEDIVQVTAGLNHTCALTTSGKVYCWGSNDLGQLGIESITSYGTAQHVFAPSIDGMVVQITAGAYHTCALLNTFEIYCWGFGSSGQLGLGANTTTDESEDDCNTALGVQNVAYCKKKPEKVSLPESVSAKPISISAGAEHTCAVTIEGNAFCWGRNPDGRLGISTTSDKNSPSSVCSSSSNCSVLTTLRPRMCSKYNIP
jgi:alpha-tubulin suppressor-like RCC1 family protein